MRKSEANSSCEILRRNLIKCENSYLWLKQWKSMVKYSTWKCSFTTLPYYSIVLITSKNFHSLSRFNVKGMGSHWGLILLYLNIFLSRPEDGRSRPKHVAKYNLTVIIVFCLDVCCVLTVHNILYKFDNTQFKDYDELETIMKIHFGTQSMDFCHYWLGNLVPNYDKFLGCGGAMCKYWFAFIQ